MLRARDGRHALSRRDRRNFERVQAKLLRVVQDGEILRVGADRPRRVDPRIVAATNRVLKDEVLAGRFREDLFFRLNVIPIRLPPLRDRREDVLPIARSFLRRHALEAGRPMSFTREAEEALLSHAWPGNVRELENSIERATVLARQTEIGPEDLLLDSESTVSEPLEGTLQAALDSAAVRRIETALERTRGNRAEAARTLGIDRTTLYRLMKRHRLSDGRED